MSGLCAVCDSRTGRPRHWGRVVCLDCADLPVKFVVSCVACEWSTTEQAKEYNRGAAKQAAQMGGNNHLKTMDISGDERAHRVETREVEHPARSESEVESGALAESEESLFTGVDTQGETNG